MRAAFAPVPHAAMHLPSKARFCVSHARIVIEIPGIVFCGDAI
jgi:hypothetical protein